MTVYQGSALSDGEHWLCAGCPNSQRKPRTVPNEAGPRLLKNCAPVTDMICKWLPIAPYLIVVEHSSEAGVERLSQDLNSVR